jgi:asparagine synthase (glutamine-hydrolysing)
MWNFNGAPASPDYLQEVRLLLNPYGPEGQGCWTKRGVELLFQTFDTIGNTDIEVQLSLSASGMVLMWDGRLDNRWELLHELSGNLSPDASDVAIVAAAYGKAKADAFKKFVGDWALSVWDPGSQSLILARDFLGTRHLYYSMGSNRVAWSTVLDPLVLLAGGTAPPAGGTRPTPSPRSQTIPASPATKSIGVCFQMSSSRRNIPAPIS